MTGPPEEPGPNSLPTAELGEQMQQGLDDIKTLSGLASPSFSNLSSIHSSPVSHHLAFFCTSLKLNLFLPQVLCSFCSLYLNYVSKENYKPSFLASSLSSKVIFQKSSFFFLFITILC
jgi:hypothetical protein